MNKLYDVGIHTSTTKQYDVYKEMVQKASESPFLPMLYPIRNPIKQFPKETPIWQVFNDTIYKA